MKKIGKLFLVGMMTFIGMMLSMKVQAADMPANPVDKPGYTLDYADEFNGDSLDKSKWTDSAQLPAHLTVDSCILNTVLSHIISPYLGTSTMV